MANLQAQYKQFNVVIRKNKSIAKDKLVNFCSSYANQWAFIKHEGDKNKDTGEVEGIHYHLVLLLPKRKRGYTLLNDIVKTFDFDNPFGIEVEQLKSLEGSIQYFTHKNDKDKTPHEFSEIVSNFNEGELRTLWECESNSLTFDRVKRIIDDSKTIVEVIQAVGFMNYNMFRNTIRDMWNSIKKGQD